MDSFASRVAARRKQIGISQTVAAERCGLNQTDISKIEKATVQDTPQILRLAQALDCNPYWLRYGEGEMLSKFETPEPGVDAQLKMLRTQITSLLLAMEPATRQRAVQAAIPVLIGFLPTILQPSNVLPKPLGQEDKPGA